MPSSLLLINPPGTEDAVANREGTATFGNLSTGFAYPPHTLASIYTSCAKTGIHVDLLDAVGAELSLEQTINRVRSLAPQQIAIFTSWGTIDIDRAAIHAIRQAFPQTGIIALGAGIRHSADELLVAGASHVLLGDPELALATLVTNALPAPGIVRVRDILPKYHNHAGLIREPDRVERPAWDQVPWQHYGFLTVGGSRGCDDRCRFCAYATLQGRAYRPRAAQSVIDEMIWLEQTYQPRRLMIRDIVFARDRRRTVGIASGLAEASFRTPWECESRPEHFDTSLLKLLAKARCTVIKFGLESASPSSLVHMGRIEHESEAAHYLAYAREVVADARRMGIITRAFVMVGVPGQTAEDIAVTAAYLREMQPTFVHVRPYVAYPRVPLGQSQTLPQIEALAAPLLAVAGELQRRAERKTPVTQRLLQRVRRYWSS